MAHTWCSFPCVRRWIADIVKDAMSAPPSEAWGKCSLLTRSDCLRLIKFRLPGLVSLKKEEHMRIFHWIGFLLTGFIVGLLARAVLPGSDKMGFLATTLVGILGSLIGGFLGGLISKPKEGSAFHPA